MNELEQNLAKTLFKPEQLQVRIRELGAEISRDYKGKDLLLVCVLKGGILFLTDLMRSLTIPHAIDFMAISSYGGTRIESSGVVRILMDLNSNIENRNVLVVEDIVDTGLSLASLLPRLSGRGPKSLRVCALIDKPGRRRADVTADYSGIVCSGGFLVGYGLDLDERCRELTAIYEIETNPSCGGLNDSPM